MMKKMNLIIIALLIFVTIISVCTIEVNADYNFSSKISSIDSKTDSSSATTSAQNVVGEALQVARIVAVGIALIMLAVLAMKYMSSAPGDKAEIKKYAVVYVVGAVVLFAASAILGIIKDFAEKNIKA